MSQIEWFPAAMVLIISVVSLYQAIWKPYYHRLRRLGLLFAGLGAMAVFLAIVIGNGEFVPWGMVAVLCLIGTFATLIGWQLETRGTSSSY